MAGPGYIKIWRQLTSWEWYDDPNTLRVFLHLLLNASWAENRWQGITIQPGQLITGRKKLAAELKLSERKIRTSLTKLKSTSEIAIKTTSKYSIITICKWETYQPDEATKRPAKRPAERPTSDQQATTTKEGKEGKEVNNTQNDVFRDNDFLRFWDMYQKKKDRHKCEKKFAKLTKAQKEKIFSTLPTYVASTPDPQYRKNPLTYLNAQSWEDEVEDPTPATKSNNLNLQEYYGTK